MAKFVYRKLDKRKLEPLWSYSLTEKDGETCLVIPGLFHEGPSSPKLTYGGRDNAVLLRRPGQTLLVNDISEDACRLLMKRDKVTVRESDTGREYAVTVIKEGSPSDNFLRDALSIHEHFPLHPYPISTGAFIVTRKVDAYPAVLPGASVAGIVQCAFCGNKTEIVYPHREPLGNAVTKVCPSCVAHSETANRVLNLFPEFTPAFCVNGKRTPIWGEHCACPSVYLGCIEKEDLTDFLRKEIIENWKTENNIFMNTDPGEILKKHSSGRMSLHLFRCSECGKRFALAFEKNRDELTDEEWDIIDVLISLLGMEEEWELSYDRHHRRCLWDREEDAPYVLEEGIRAIAKESAGKLDKLGLPEDRRNIIKDLFKEFGA
ncbi:MAG: CbrC family protein [Lachnospiraceae bacterium]|nr:CbrC family protein [Lachnospiraceae bacterium]